MKIRKTKIIAIVVILILLAVFLSPNLDKYIQNLKKVNYATLANNYIGVMKEKREKEEILQMTDQEATYYLPASCLILEEGKTTPFGNLEEAYVVITYDANEGYKYYWTSRDETNMGIPLTSEESLNSESVKSGITSINPLIGIGEKNKIFLIDSCDGSFIRERWATSTIKNISK